MDKNIERDITSEGTHRIINLSDTITTYNGCKLKHVCD